MAELEEFKFIIPAFTPETMPIDRLMDYLSQVVILLGEPHELHLIRIEESSTRPVLAMARPVGLKARKRVAEVEAGGGSARRRNAYTRVQNMVEEDGAGAAFLEAPEGAVLLKFEAPESVGKTLSGIRQTTSIQGELIRVGGAQERVALLIQDETGETISGCYTNRRLAKELGSYLFEQIRVSGEGIWMRTPAGSWSLERMQVQSFVSLEERPLADVIRDLQAIPVDWPPDTLERLRELRNDN